MEIIEHAISEPCVGVLVEPAAGSTVSVLVLAGSSGRVDADRCRVLARAGMAALSIRWFGGDGQPAGICEIPLETFVAAIDLLQTEGAERIGVLGVSNGAEASLLPAVRDPRIDAVVALSPTSVVWANVGPGTDGATRPYRSSWTWKGEPVAFIPYDDDWTPAEAEGAPMTCRTLYERSRQVFPDAGRACWSLRPVRLRRLRGGRRGPRRRGMVGHRCRVRRKSSRQELTGCAEVRLHGQAAALWISSLSDTAVTLT